MSLFFQNVPFYPNSSIQGETTDLRESHNWEAIRPALPQLEPIKAAAHPSPMSNTPPEPSSPNPITTTLPIHVYSRRKQTHKENQQQSEHDQLVIDPSSKPKYIENTQGIDTNNTSHVEHCETDNRPIVLRKGTRSCTQHPICNFACLEHFSLAYQAFCPG